MTTIVESKQASAEVLKGALGAECDVVTGIDALRHHLEERPDEPVVVLGPSVNMQAAVSLAEAMRLTRPALSIILVRPRIDSSVLTEALRSGMREVVEERDLTTLSLAVRRAHALFRALTTERSGGDTQVLGKVITVFSAKGGVGKTTVSTNLAVALSQLGRRVCLVDFDLAFGDVAISLQMMPEHSIAEVAAINGEIGPDDLKPLLVKYSDTLSALLGPTSPDPAEGQVKEVAAKIIAALKQSFDYVVVDTPPAFEDQVLQAFDVSDLLLLLLTPDIPALKNLKITLEMLELLNFPRDKYRVVLNRAGAKVGLSERDMEKTLKTPIFASVPAAPEVPAAINRGEPIVTALPKHVSSQAILAIARDAVRALAGAGPDVQAPARTEDTERRRLFHRRSVSA